MLQYPQFSPDVFSIGPLTVRWYGLMYLFGFISAWILGRRRAARGRLLNREQFEDILTWGIVGVIVGARLGYVVFYDPVVYLRHPLQIFALWQGGMSFHGGMIGVMVAQWLSGKRHGKSFFEVMDFMAPLVPPGLFFGRLGNFINGELWGRITDVSWGMVFPGAGPLPRHPSQLYEAALEGVVLFTVLWIFSAKPRPRMAVSGVFALGYGMFRIFVEFFRQPDVQLGYLAFGFVTMGMVLCLPLIAVGALLLARAYTRKDSLPA